MESATGEAEVDQDGGDAGDPAAKGSAMFLQVDQRTVCYGAALRGAGEPTVVHIHKGKAGQNGPPVVTFNNSPRNADGAPSGDPGASSGCKTTEDEAEIAASPTAPCAGSSPSSCSTTSHHADGEVATRG